MTGGNRGLGAALVRLLAAESFRVVFSSREPVDEATLPPGASCILVGDFADPANVRSFAERALAALNNRVDVLFNNAGEFAHKVRARR